MRKLALFLIPLLVGCSTAREALVLAKQNTEAVVFHLDMTSQIFEDYAGELLTHYEADSVFVLDYPAHTLSTGEVVEASQVVLNRNAYIALMEGLSGMTAPLKSNLEKVTGYLESGIEIVDVLRVLRGLSPSEWISFLIDQIVADRRENATAGETASAEQ
jgi:hypothetical protein